PNPADVPTAQAPGDHCVGVFPHYSYVHFLPLVRSAGDGGAPRLPNAGSGLSLGKQAGLLVPLGDQLGDVGQYYSQVAPSMVSTLTVENSTPLTQTFSLNLRSDRGVVARSLHRCPVAPGATLALQIKAGELWLADTNRQLPAASICEPTAAQAEPAGQALPTLQGIYHAELTTSAANPFTFTVETASDPNQPSIVYQTKSNYRAVPEQLARGTVYLPALVATRTQDNWWDTELVVQNVTHQATNLQFRLCDDEGRCFANNLATLQAYERRIFLASHLLYADDAGFLDERAGWFSATLTATPADDPGEDPRVVVLTNLFRQTVALNKREPQAEQGSDCLLQAELLAPTQQLDYTTTAVNEVVVRVYNPGPTTNAVQLNLVDHQGQPLKTLNALVAASGTAFWSIPDIFHETTSLPGETVTLQVQAQQAIVAFVWQNGSIVRPQTISQATTWYAPLVAAPTVPFRWDSSAGDPSRSTHPGSSFGLAETQRAYHPQRPEWARRLNWYIWSANQQSCNETVAEAEPYSTYIPMWWGLGGCSDAGNDRSCVNSPNRLQKLRNDLPSNCTGRPLFLANEPDLPAPQSFMTYHELG
ncbi:MAG TPA: hypothetical protein PKE45_21185, partial [Caldilineaceae bacterium]|nr:hypothetical protein [Caldilineaceae bacterium]